MEKNNLLPYVKNIKPRLLSDKLESISDEEASRRFILKLRKTNDDISRHFNGRSNKQIHGMDEKEE
jgi:hypothetical protein